MQKILCVICLLIIGRIVPAQKPHGLASGLAERYWYIIESPHAPVLWDAWRIGLTSWKDSVLKAVDYNSHFYEDPSYQWASKAYSCLLLMANDRSLYDAHWNYDIENCLRKYETGCGGVDIVLLWATYPQLGFDNRDQYSFYRNLPGGIVALKKLSDELHRKGKKFFIAYNPWDQIGRNNGKDDEEELIKLVKEIGADGIFLDTISNVTGFRKKLEAAKHGVVFQSEMSPEPGSLDEVQQSWMELPIWNEAMKNAEYNEVPYILRSRWLEQRHMTYHLSRWSHDQSTVIQNAWMNGCGVVLWENVFGVMNPLTGRDRSCLQSMLPLLRQYSDWFTRGKWTPLVATRLGRTYASCWEFGSQKLWTIINRAGQDAMGPILTIRHSPGTRYFDLVQGIEAPSVIDQGEASISIHLKPQAIGCILSIPDSEINNDFNIFLHKQAAIYNNAGSATTYKLPSHTLKPVLPTKSYPASAIPSNMRRIEVPADSFLMPIHFRQRECGFYPAGGVTDISYTMAVDAPGIATDKIKLSEFAIDETLVTNAEFERFLMATHYRPEFPENFLKDWENGHPVKGMEKHPVVWVDINDARSYAAWAHKRLPRQTEWQWAAQSAEKALAFPWGNTYDSTRCNHGQTGTTTAVKQFPNGRTAQGLYDMCGNVWEFTESERTDGNNDYCILRGGSWYTTRGSGWYADQGPQQSNFAAKYLFTWPGLDRCATVGFRCVVDTGH